MSNETFRIKLETQVNLDDAELTLGLAALAAEGLFSAAMVRMEAGYRRLDAEHVFLLDAGSEVGRAVVQMFTTFLAREFGQSSFTVTRTNDASNPLKEPIAA